MDNELKIVIHPHALQRASERGAKENEVITTVLNGEKFSAKHGRTGFRLNFIYNEHWNDRYYASKQIEAYAVFENSEWIVVTVIVKYF